jgi:predicted Zn-ribbon and HTH transcriptional regulator
MGQLAAYKCQKCGEEFNSQDGGGFHFAEYRCMECDSVKTIDLSQTASTEKIDIGSCKKCGGELKAGINPMCPVCKSREVEKKQVLLQYD